LPSSHRGPSTLFKTASGGAYALQLHASDQKEALANAAVIAPAGQGKTTFFEHLIGGALRHDRLRAYIFDPFNGTRIFTEATGGTYIDLADEVQTQLNPLQVDDTQENRTFVHQFQSFGGGACARPSINSSISRSGCSSLPLSTRGWRCNPPRRSPGEKENLMRRSHAIVLSLPVPSPCILAENLP
jgi:hypothetical protein